MNDQHEIQTLNGLYQDSTEGQKRNFKHQRKFKAPIEYRSKHLFFLQIDSNSIHTNMKKPF